MAECTLKLNRAVAFDTAEELAGTSRFVLVDDYEIRGGGIVREALPDRQADIRDKVMLRNFKWEPSIIAPERRAEKYGQQRLAAADYRRARRRTERRSPRTLEAPALRGRPGGLLPRDGQRAVRRGRRHRAEGGQPRRAPAAAGRGRQHPARRWCPADRHRTGADQEDLEVVKTSVDPDRIELVWVGDRVTTDVPCDLILGDEEAESEGVDRIKRLLQDKGMLFRPW